MGRIYENLQKQSTIPPQDIATTYKELKELKERQERYAAREKYRQDTEIYGEIFYNWDEILRERNLQSKHREIERQTRINKASNLKGTWDLMKVCKGFLEEWEIDWVEGSEKAKERQDKKEEEIDKNYRFRRIEIKRQDQIRNKLWSQSTWRIRKQRMGGRSQTRKVGAAGTQRESVEMEGQRRWEDKNWQGEDERTRQENKRQETEEARRNFGKRKTRSKEM